MNNQNVYYKNYFLSRKPLKLKQKNSNKRGKKTVKDKKNTSQESANASNFNMTNLLEDENADIVINEVDISIYHDYFRELDIDTWLILTQKFVINPDSDHVSELNYNIND